MGLTFLSEQDRNPIKQPLSHEQLQAQKPEPCAELQAQLNELEKKLELHEQFLNDNGYGVLFDVFVDLINGKITPEQYGDLTGNIEFEEVTE